MDLISKVMDFTSKEKTAIINVLWTIMKADGVVDQREQNFVDAVYRKLGVTADEVYGAAHMEESECRRILSSLPEEKKNKVSKCFLDLVGIDGRVDLRELTVIHKMFKSEGD